MPKLPPYAVLVRDLPTQRTFDVPSALVAEWLRGMPQREALGAPDPDPDAGSGHAELELYAETTHAFASGKFTGSVTVACSRCVNPVSLPIDERLTVTFLPVAEMPTDEDDDKAAEDGPEVAEDDLDVYAFDGERIDLEPLFREQFVLAIPYAPLCKDDCLGLCPQCGIDRNTGTCSCVKPLDPRLEPLKGLKIPS